MLLTQLRRETKVKTKASILDKFDGFLQERNPPG